MVSDSVSQKPLPKLRSLMIAWSLVILTATADVAIGVWSHSLALIANLISVRLLHGHSHPDLNV